MTRRSFLQAGVLGLGGLALPDLLPASRGQRGGGSARDGAASSCSGSAAGRATWRPGTPSPTPRREFRGPFGAIATSVPGRPVRRAAARAGAADGPAGGPPDGQPRHRRPHQGQPLDADRLRGPGLQRPRQHGPAPAVDGLGGGPAARRRAGRACRPTSPCRTCGAGPTTSSTTRPISAAAPTRSSSSPTRTTRSSGSRT